MFGLPAELSSLKRLGGQGTERYHFGILNDVVSKKTAEKLAVSKTLTQSEREHIIAIEGKGWAGLLKTRRYHLLAHFGVVDVLDLAYSVCRHLLTKKSGGGQKTTVAREYLFGCGIKGNACLDNYTQSGCGHVNLEGSMKPRSLYANSNQPWPWFEGCKGKPLDTNDILPLTFVFKAITDHPFTCTALVFGTVL
jgi:hypothetical protein